MHHKAKAAGHKQSVDLQKLSVRNPQKTITKLSCGKLFLALLFLLDIVDLCGTGSSYSSENRWLHFLLHWQQNVKPKGSLTYYKWKFESIWTAALEWWKEQCVPEVKHYKWIKLSRQQRLVSNINLEEIRSMLKTPVIFDNSKRIDGAANDVTEETFKLFLPDGAPAETSVGHEPLQVPKDHKASSSKRRSLWYSVWLCLQGHEHTLWVTTSSKGYEHTLLWTPL